MKPYYDPESRPNVPPSIEMPDEPPIPEDELPDDALVDNTPIPTDTILEDDSATYDIERIIRERTCKGKKQFLVKWEGCGPEHNSWVDETDIIHLQQSND